MMRWYEMKNFSINRPTEEDLKDLLKERIVIMDGAMGTMIQQEKLEEEDYTQWLVSLIQLFIKFKRIFCASFSWQVYQPW